MANTDEMKCCMCGKGKDDGLAAIAKSKTTGHCLCKECAGAVYEELNIDMETLQKAAVLSFVQRNLLDQKKDDDGTCNCPRCMYDKMKRAEAGADTSREGFAAEPITDTRH